MEVKVDMALCDGHGLCVGPAPDVFHLGEEDDLVTVLDPHPPETLRAGVVEAAFVCPKGAITIVD